jgi:pimeloyl-ACP methyl ester carboxylesterase
MAPSTPHLIYVHGLFMNGSESLVLRRRLLRDFGTPVQVHAFRYRSTTANMADITARLAAYVRELAPTTLHLVAHSLGGLVVQRFFEHYPEQPPGRVVLMGSPMVASRAAAAIARVKWATTMVGRCVAEELFTERPRRWFAERELGVIAGTKPMGLGRLFTRFDEDSDGTVAVSETRVPGARDFLNLPVSHMGLLLSARAAHETAAFLQTGKFLPRL